MGDENKDGDNNKDKHRNIVLDQIGPYIDKQNITAVGVSYGATTVSFAATLQPNKCQCAALLDPWLPIDISST